MKTAYRMSVVVVLLMAVQAITGLAFPELYRDEGFVGETWFGNDWVTLVLAVPLLAVALLLERRGSVRGRLLWFGALGYCCYSYAFYLLGATLNHFFPFYVLLLVLSVLALIIALAHTRALEVAALFSSRTPTRLIAGYWLFVAFGLTSMWMVTWALHVFAGQPTPIAPEAFRLVAALDLSVTVPALTASGLLLWRRNAWGYVLSVIIGIKSSLYLLLLALNSLLFIQRGMVEAPGELPMWGTLAVATLAATAALLANVQGQWVQR